MPGIATAGTLIGAAIIVLAQSVFNPFADAIERVLGGSLLLGAAYMIVRWTFRLLQEARETASADRDASLEREKLLITQLANATEQLAEVNAQLTAERSLRISLEQRGLTDRRSNEID